MQDRISDEFDIIIEARVRLFDNSFALEDNPSLQLLSLGEIVDRLSIINFKLFTLKNRVMETDDEKFLAFAAKEDVKLVEERSRLKRCIDEKVDQKIKEIVKYRKSSFNPEVKSYE